MVKVDKYLKMDGVIDCLGNICTIWIYTVRLLSMRVLFSI
jgi:hypothetical protein